MTPKEKLEGVALASGIMWAMVLAIAVIVNISTVTTVVAIFAALVTFALLAMWAVDAFDIDPEGKKYEGVAEKAKRDDDIGGDARLATLLALLTPDERDALRDRLVDDLSGDGESVSLADLLADDEAAGDAQAGRAR